MNWGRSNLQKYYVPFCMMIMIVLKKPPASVVFAELYRKIQLYNVFNGDGGSRTHAPLRTYRISSATSYDHLSTSPNHGIYYNIKLWENGREN